MTETFYSVLGVDDDADAERIRRAYRELLKETHPDVSDDPAARERFKRLTTAKETLTDGDERARYDRLGHGRYVDEHVASGPWSAGTEHESPATARKSPAGSTREQQPAGGVSRGAWLGDDGEPGAAERTARSAYRTRRQRRPSSTATSNENWQYASEVYRTETTGVGTGKPSSPRTVEVLHDVGPWLVVHLVFVLSGIATAWVVFVQVDRHLHLSWPVVLLGGIFVGLVVFVSVLHVVTRVYA